MPDPKEEIEEQPNEPPKEEVPPASPPITPAKKDESEDQLLKEIAADLKKDLNTQIDLSHLKIRDQIQTLRSLKAAQTPKEPVAPKPKPKVEHETTPPPPDVPKFVYKSICEINGPNSEFMSKLHSRKAIGSNVLSSLFGDN